MMKLKGLLKERERKEPINLPQAKIEVITLFSDLFQAKIYEIILFPDLLQATMEVIILFPDLLQAMMEVITIFPDLLQAKMEVIPLFTDVRGTTILEIMGQFIGILYIHNICNKIGIHIRRL